MGVPFSQSCTFSWLSAVCSVSLHRHKRCTNSEPSLTCYTLSAPRHRLIPVLSTILEAIGALELKVSGLICAKEKTRDLDCIVRVDLQSPHLALTIEPQLFYLSYTHILQLSTSCDLLGLTMMDRCCTHFNSCNWAQWDLLLLVRTPRGYPF